MTNRKIYVKAVINFEVSFWPYNSEKKNRMAIAQTARNIRYIGKDMGGTGGFLPICVEYDDETGAPIEDCTQPGKVRVATSWAQRPTVTSKRKSRKRK